MVQVAMKKIREQKGLSRAQLARDANMQAGVITWIEEGRFIPYDSQLDKIARELGVKDKTELLKPIGVVTDDAKSK